jgi:hypothetical protein
MVVRSLLDNVTQESGTSLARAELRAVQDSGKLADCRLPRYDGPLGRRSNAVLSVLMRQAHNCKIIPHPTLTRVRLHRMGLQNRHA